MDDPLLKQLSEVIAQNLPSQVGDALRKRLEQAEKDAVQVKHTNDLYGRTCAEKNELQAKLDKHGELDLRFRELDAKMAKIAEQEKALDAKAARQEINDAFVRQADQRIADLKDVVSLVFQSKYRFSEQISRNKMEPDNRPNAYGGSTVSTSENITRTVEEQKP